MSESHEFLCTTCGKKLDYPAVFEGQTKICEGCGLSTVLKKSASTQGPTAAAPTPITTLPPADQPSPPEPVALGPTAPPEPVAPEPTALEPSEANPLAVAGMVCGILALLTECCCGGLPFNIAGLVLSIIALKKIKADPNMGGKGMAIAGLICSSISLIVGVILFILGSASALLEAVR